MCNGERLIFWQHLHVHVHVVAMCFVSGTVLVRAWPDSRSGHALTSTVHASANFTDKILCQTLNYLGTIFLMLVNPCSPTTTLCYTCTMIYM